MIPTTSAGAPPGTLSADLVVLSHLRWPWVWQRPQHLVSRLAGERAAAGARTWFVEEPIHVGVDEPRLCSETIDVDGATVERVWYELPGDHPLAPFGEPGSEGYASALTELIGTEADVWLYTPMALDLAEALTPRLLVYDVMDDLASFANAPEGLRLRQRRLLNEADVVFAGGRSLHAGVSKLRRRGQVQLYPSGVETAHYASSRALRAAPSDNRRPVAGYVGVIDERLDLALLGQLATQLEEWEIQVVGPVTKVEAGDLPQAPNIRYFGIQPYDRLPQVMAEFDVALMPFALNEATRSISPTKTLEYLAAGLPVVSTRVADVVADFGPVVHFADTSAEFAAACRKVIDDCRDERDARVAPIERRHEWDVIAAEMSAHLKEALAAADAAQVPQTMENSA